MSHFTVLVVGPDPEGQLDPYWELDLPKEELAADYRAEFEVRVPADEFAKHIRSLIKDLKARGNITLASKYSQSLKDKQYEQVLQDYYGGCQGPEGDWGYYANPQAKWDWHQLGGRWAGSLQLKPGRKGVHGEPSWCNADEPQTPEAVDQARKGDIDWTATARTLEAPFAVLKHGEWHQQGEMGWFGLARDMKPEAEWTAEVQALLADVADDELISLYDCHI